MQNVELVVIVIVCAVRVGGARAVDAPEVSASVAVARVALEAARQVVETTGVEVP